MRDHTPVSVTEFKGNFSRGEVEVTPQEYFIDSLNIKFTNKGVQTRDGSRLSAPLNAVRRVATYARTGEAERLLILDGAGNLFDSTDLSAPILSVVGMTDFSMVPIFNRAYITPHDGRYGLANERVYVYDGIGGARPAAGQPVSTGPLTLADGPAGSVEAGDHAFGVAYITKSGFITKPGAFVQYTAPGSKKADISNIPLGDPDFVIGRIIVATKIETTFTDFESLSYFFVPGGQIDNNTDTFVSVDFFDADLEDSADYLFEQVTEIPAGVGITLANGRMITWGEKAFPNVFRASTIGEPESVNGVEGFGTVNPGDAGTGIKNVTELRGALYLCKSRRTYATQDNGDSPATWKILPADKGVGTECHGFAKVLDFGEDVEDTVFVADRSGLRLFNGSFPEDGILTHSIDDIWGRITTNAFHTVELVVDPNAKFICVLVPLDGAMSPNALLYADFNEDLKNIKWTTWTFPNDMCTLVLNIVDDATILKVGSQDGNLYQIDPTCKNDYGSVIDNYIQFAMLPQQSDDVVYSFTGCKLRIRGEANVTVQAIGLDNVTSVTGESLDLTTTTSQSLVSLFGLDNERCSVKIRVNFFNQYFILTKFTVYYKPLWDS